MSDNTTALTRTLQQSLEAKSLTDLVREQTDYPMLLIDVSGSMFSRASNDRSCLDNLRDVYAQVQAEGAITTIAFGGRETSEARFVDHVPDAGGGTPLHQAIRLAREYGATRVVIISDGMPDLRDESMLAAQEFGGRVDVCYVGEPDSMGSFFLDELAQATGGTRFEGNIAETKEIAGRVTLLLAGDVEEPERAPIVGEGFSAQPADAPDDEDDDDEDDEEEDDDR